MGGLIDTRFQPDVPGWCIVPSLFQAFRLTLQNVTLYYWAGQSARLVKCATLFSMHGRWFQLLPLLACLYESQAFDVSSLVALSCFLPVIVHAAFIDEWKWWWTQPWCTVCLQAAGVVTWQGGRRRVFKEAGLPTKSPRPRQS